MRLNNLATYGLIASAIVVGISSCSMPSYADMNAVYSTTAENVASDNVELAGKLEKKIAQCYPSVQVKIDANNFNVLIVGQVNSDDVKNKITALVRQQAGVNKVWNYATVSAKPKLDVNADLIARATDRVKVEKNIYPQNVTIDAVGGDVYLMGSNIGNLAYFDKVVRGIEVMDGVNKVVDLSVAGPNDYRSEEDTDK